MKRLALPGPACALALALAAGCGPLSAPMPARLDDANQKQVDAGWDRALAPGRLDHQGLLDLMVEVQLYQLGVDTLTFRSEKRVARGTVVMKLGYDRAKPDDDRFTVTLLDKAGKVLRAERFTRAEVEQTVKDLHQPQGAGGPEPPEVLARRKRVADLFAADEKKE